MEKIPLIEGINSPVFVARERVRILIMNRPKYAEKGIILGSEL